MIDADDLRLFCRFDAENDQCLRNCGYEIQFNMFVFSARAQFEFVRFARLLGAIMFVKDDKKRQVAVCRPNFYCRARARVQMIANLPCYAHAAPTLKRICGELRCGPYEELQLSLLGYTMRCRSLVCDLMCTSRRENKKKTFCQSSKIESIFFITKNHRSTADAFQKAFFCASAAFVAASAPTIMRSTIHESRFEEAKASAKLRSTRILLLLPFV